MSPGVFICIGDFLAATILEVVLLLFGYIVLGPVLAAIVIAVTFFLYVCWKKSNRSPAGDANAPDSNHDTPSFTQDHAGDGSDICNAPDFNTPFTQNHGRGESVVLQQPPLIVTRYNRASDSDMGPLVTDPASPSTTLPPMFLDGRDG